MLPASLKTLCLDAQQNRININTTDIVVDTKSRLDNNLYPNNSKMTSYGIQKWKFKYSLIDLNMSFEITR
jgi:hypothetical protein